MTPIENDAAYQDALIAQVRKQSLLVAAGHQTEAEIDNWLMKVADTEGWE